MEPELLNLLKDNIEKYPAMQLQDCVKLLYQRILGSEHMAISYGRCYDLLKAEKEKTGTDVSFIRYEELGDNSCRINLLSLPDDKASLHTLTNLFLQSIQTLSANIFDKKVLFTEALTFLLKSVKEGLLPFDYAETEAYIKKYIEDGCPPVHHSQIYRDTYHPAYRLIRTDFARYFSLFEAIDKLIREKEHVIIAIDGKCGSGKSTLANILSEVYSSNIIHMDDFYLPLDLRTKERLNEPGGNVHYERFASQILPALSDLKQKVPGNNCKFTDHTYQIFDCHTMDYKEKPGIIADRPLTIVEGSYSLRPELIGAYDLKVFLDISLRTQKERLLARNGEEAFKNFESKWIPMELKYFDEYDIKNCCDLAYQTDLLN